MGVQENQAGSQASATRKHTISGEIVRVCLLVRPFRFFPYSDIFKHLAYL